MRLSPLLIAALIVAGCNASTPGASPNEAEAAKARAELIGQWRLASLRGRDVDPPGGKGMASSVRFLEGGDVGGSGGCNRFSGTWEGDGQALSVGPLAATKMACPGMMEMERGFFAVLAETARYRMDDGMLELLDAQGAVMARLRPAERAKGENGG